jgi:hypothetical protein
MDPILPIAPGPPIFPQGGPEPVQKLDRVTRERARREDQQSRRRKPQPPALEGGEDEEDGEHPHIDVRA